MTFKGDDQSFIDHLTQSAMKKVSRRGFFKGAGAIGLAFLGVFGLAQGALAYIRCPPNADGICDNCATSCVTGGKSCSKVCSNCYLDPCNPINAIVLCRWANSDPTHCIFWCDFYAC